MSKLLAFMMLSPFMLILLFQPTLDRLEEAREKVVQVAIQRATEKAALDGYYTEDTILEMHNMLNLVGYNQDDIEFVGTLTPTNRGENVEGTLKAPNEYQFLLFEKMINVGETSEKHHIHSASRMSEFIN